MQKTLVNWISDLLWPHRCLGCNLRGTPLCLDCLRATNLRPSLHTIADGLRVTSGGNLGEPLLSAAIWHLKYRNMPSLAASLATWLAWTLARTPQPATLLRPTSLVIPVPLHAKRLLERGYNQAELVARTFASIAALPLATDTLARTRYTDPQVQSSGRTERFTNMAGAFACIRPGIVRGRAILLVDDVCTTGATLAACANELKTAGACTVTAVVLARA